MIFIASFVGWIREVVRHGVLWFFRDPSDPHFNPLKDIVEVCSYYFCARSSNVSLATSDTTRAEVIYVFTYIWRYRKFISFAAYYRRKARIFIL